MTISFDLPSEILPSREERFAVHLRRLEELVQRQRQLQIDAPLGAIVLEKYIERRCFRIVIDAFGGKHLLDLGARFERRFDRFDLYVKLERTLRGPFENGCEVLKD